MVMLILLLLLSACADKTAENSAEPADDMIWQDYYDLGVRYLSDGNYQEAIIAFTAAIEIDPKQGDAYRALADVYVALGDYKAAIDTLRQGAEEAGDPDFWVKAEEIEQMLAKIETTENDEESIEEPENVLTRINYYDPDGALIYHEDYLYYSDGKLGYALMTKLERYGDTAYDGMQYSQLYLYTREGQLERTVLNGMSIGDWFDESTGKVIMGFDHNSGDKSTETSIYPARESVEQKKFGVDPARTERMYGTPGYFPATEDSRWARAYLNEVFSGQGYTDETHCSFLYIDNDPIPELMVDYSYGFAGAQILTTTGGTPDTVWYDHGSCGYLKREGLVRVSGGHMDEYYDGIYRVEDGKFIQIGNGSYGAEDNANIEYDATGYPIYQYYWNVVETSKEGYAEQMGQIYDQGREIIAGQWPLTYDQCKLLWSGSPQSKST